MHPTHWLISTQVIGQDFLGPRFDAAVFHALTGAQEGLVVEYNWVLGPSLVSFARLDTASSTTPDEAGSHTTIRRNVHLGLGITTKGYNHTVEHNTGSRFLAVESWKLVTNSAEINQCVRPAWRYYLLFWPPRRVLGVLARGVLGLLTRAFDFRTGDEQQLRERGALQRAHRGGRAGVDAALWGDPGPGVAQCVRRPARVQLPERDRRALPRAAAPTPRGRRHGRADKRELAGARHVWHCVEIKQ